MEYGIYVTKGVSITPWSLLLLTEVLPARTSTNQVFAGYYVAPTGPGGGRGITRTVRMRIAVKGRRGDLDTREASEYPADRPSCARSGGSAPKWDLGSQTLWIALAIFLSHFFMMSAKNWCFTLNNWTQPEYDHIVEYANSCSDCIYFVAGREVGDSGTPHLQGFICFGSRRSLNAVKSALSARMHLEVARGTPEEASVYCKKDGDYVEYGTLPPSQGHRADWDSFREYVMDLGRVPNDLEIAGRFPSLFARYSSACRTIAQACLPRPRLVAEGSTLRDWQSSLRDALIGECEDDRSILFYVDSEGNTGKSWFCRYMLDNYEERVQMLGVGRVTDIAYMIDPEKDIFLIDCERSASEFLQYRVLEQMKNRIVTSTKYTATMKVIRKVPHVVVFMNEPPKMDALSADRYVVIDLNE